MTKLGDRLTGRWVKLWHNKEITNTLHYAWYLRTTVTEERYGAITLGNQHEETCKQV